MSCDVMSCDQARETLGVYVLGALEPHERTELDRHLARCPASREELAGLAGLRGLLGRLTLADVTGEMSANPDRPVEQPPPELLDRLLAQAPDPSRRRPRSTTSRRRLLSVATACNPARLSCCGDPCLGIGAGGIGGSGPATTATDPVTHVALQATLHHRDWGTAVDVRLHGVAPGERCRLLAVDRVGHSEVAASWQASYDGEADLTRATAIPRATLTTLRVVTEDDRQLVMLPISP